MKHRAAAVFVPLLLSALGGAACSDPGPGTDGDADADGDHDADGDGSADSDVDVPVPGGPLLLAARAIMVAGDRRCDVDGDGSPDNAVAELGASGSSMFVMAINAALSSGLAAGRYPVFHIRWVEDLSGPDAASADFAAYMGLDSDWPADPTDDLSGVEPLYSGAYELDRDGEPTELGRGLRIEGGAISGGSGFFPLAIGDQAARLSITRLGGTVEPFGEAFELWVCGALPVREVGDLPVDDIPGRTGLTMLELLLLGGAVFGMDAVPGLRPDLDLDGDGLETFIVDGEGAIERCVDGDRTVIEGADCWQDERMADAFSLTLEFAGVSATWAGRQPAWEYRVPPGGSPPSRQESFFSTVLGSDGQCAELDARCDPRLPEPCCDSSHRCSGADRFDYRCYGPCEPSPCDYGGLLGTCKSSGEGPDPICAPIGPPFVAAHCVLGEADCTTIHDVSVGTACLGDESSARCFELCSPAAAPCAAEHQCIPRAFESGGVCAFSETTIPRDEP